MSHLAEVSRLLGMTIARDKTTTGRRVVVVGGGFAGVWSALGAVRRLRELKLAAEVDVTVVSPDEYLGIRPRFYEAELDSLRVELAHVLAPVGVTHVPDRVVGVNQGDGVVELGSGALRYDALVWAAGSTLEAPKIPGSDLLHNVDTFAAARALDRHLRSLAGRSEAAASTVVVVGAGFTGLEVAAELRDRLENIFGSPMTPRVFLIERASTIAPEYGPDGRAVIERALADLGVEVRTSTGVSSVSADAVRLASGEVIAAGTVIWTGGVRANRATRLIGEAADSLGRLDVDEMLHVRDSARIWAAGDVARASVDGSNFAMMSCQHAMPQGRFAGYNAASWLAGKKQRRYEQNLYVTCLDLGR